jgi:methyltransferase
VCVGARFYGQLSNDGALILIPIVILACVTAQRLYELVLARQNTTALLAQGGKEIGAAHYPIIVLFHAAWILGLWLLARDQAVNWNLIGVFVVLQALRVWVLATLGPRWTTRIILMPEKPLVIGGPFNYVRHPNYAVVAAEIFVLPLAFGLIKFALISGIINLGILAYRIRIEEAALAPKRV